VCVRYWYAMLVTVVCLNISGCGDSTGNDANANSSSPVAIFQSFSFTATVDYISGSPLFNVAIGDKLNGKITYQSNADDWNIYSVNQGWFHDMASPSRIEFNLNSLTYTSSDNEYYILIENDDASVPPVRDIFAIYSRSNEDPYLSSTFELRDFTASVFSTSTCNSLPQSLNISNFSNNEMFITYNNSVASWGIRLVPDTLTGSSGGVVGSDQGDMLR